MSDQSKPKLKSNKWKLWAGGAVAVIVIAAIVTPKAKDAPQADPTTVATSLPAIPPASVAAATAAPVSALPAAIVVTEQVVATVTEPAVVSIAPEPPVATSSAEPIFTPMPDVVCMNLQKAQNLIQEGGVFLSLSEDASGEGRAQLKDSNWIVVAQTPDVGELISEGDAVLSVVKTDEPNPC